MKYPNISQNYQKYPVSRPSSYVSVLVWQEEWPKPVSAARNYLYAYAMSVSARVQWARLRTTPTTAAVAVQRTTTKLARALQRQHELCAALLFFNEFELMKKFNLGDYPMSNQSREGSYATLPSLHHQLAKRSSGHPTTHHPTSAADDVAAAKWTHEDALVIIQV